MHHCDHQTNHSRPAPPRPERNPLREQHEPCQQQSRREKVVKPSCSFSLVRETNANSMLPPCNVVIPGFNKSCSNSGLQLDTPHTDPEPALPGVFLPDPYTRRAPGHCAQHNHPTATAHPLCLEGSRSIMMSSNPSNRNQHPGYSSDTHGSRSSISLFDVEEMNGFMPSTPCIAQGPILPATCGPPPVHTIHRKPASPDLRADYLRSATLPTHSFGYGTTIDLPMKGALGGGLGLGITLHSEAGSSDALFDDSATITPTTISLSTHMMDRFNNESNKTVVPASGKRAATSRSFFAAPSSPMSPPIIVVSHTESQAKQDRIISPKSATKAKSKLKSKSKSTPTGTKKRGHKFEESKSTEGYASPPPLAPQLVRTRSGYSRHH